MSPGAGRTGGGGGEIAAAKQLDLEGSAMNRRIPTDEEFARASRLMEEKSRKLDTVREELEVAFEWDSNENVEENYEDDYYLRLR